MIWSRCPQVTAIGCLQCWSPSRATPPSTEHRNLRAEPPTLSCRPPKILGLAIQKLPRPAGSGGETPAFRERALMAYRQSCAICRLRHKELLDSAHILPDLHPLSEPVVSNGLSLVLSTT